MNRRIGFDVEDGFHGRGDGCVIELEEILGYIATTSFTVHKIWIAPELYKSLTAAILAPLAIPSPPVRTEITAKFLTNAEAEQRQNDIKSGYIEWSYRHSNQSLPFFLDPDIRADRLVLEGEQA